MKSSGALSTIFTSPKNGINKNPIMEENSMSTISTDVAKEFAWSVGAKNFYDALNEERAQVSYNADDKGNKVVLKIDPADCEKQPVEFTCERMGHGSDNYLVRVSKGQNSEYDVNKMKEFGKKCIHHVRDGMRKAGEKPGKPSKSEVKSFQKQKKAEAEKAAKQKKVEAEKAEKQKKVEKKAKKDAKKLKSQTKEIKKLKKKLKHKK